MPSIPDYVYKDHIIRNTVGVGGNALIFGGEHRRTGTAVAVKEIRRTINNHVGTSRAIMIGTILGSHPYMIELLDDILPDDNDLLPPSFVAGSDELHLVFSPLCNHRQRALRTQRVRRRLEIHCITLAVAGRHRVLPSKRSNA